MASQILTAPEQDSCEGLIANATRSECPQTQLAPERVRHHCLFNPSPFGSRAPFPVAQLSLHPRGFWHLPFPPAPTSLSPRLPACWPAHHVCWHGKAEPRGRTKEGVDSHLRLQAEAAQSPPRLPGICWAPIQTPADNDESSSPNPNHRDQQNKLGAQGPFPSTRTLSFLVLQQLQSL